MKIEFEFQTDYGTFRDAIWVPDDAPMPTDFEIEAMKQARLAAWLAVFTETVSG